MRRFWAVWLAVLLAAGSSSAQSFVSADGRRVFRHGVGWSPWHAKYGWHRPPEVIAQDWGLLAGLRANALRTWGPTSAAGLAEAVAHGLAWLPELGRGKRPQTIFRDGSQAGMPVFCAPETLADIREQGRKLARAVAGQPGLLGYNLGNEYTCTGQDSRKNYVYHGFDPVTLAAFRQRLGQRFGTIDQLNTAAGTRFASFDEVTPPGGVDRSVVWWEWWLFQRSTVTAMLRAGVEGIREVDRTAPITYARLCGNRWDPATEDLDLPFTELAGDNLYFHWDNDWGKFCARLDRVIGPGRPAVLTEGGVNTLRVPNPATAARQIKQMLWMSVLHPEVAGIFPFVYCDEWWAGGNEQKQEGEGAYWGLLTADRQPKSTYHAVADTYRTFDELGRLLTERQSPPEVVLTNQVVDWWRGGHGPSADEVSRWLYRHGVSFRVVSLLQPETLRQTNCAKLVMLDGTLPDEPDGTCPAADALSAQVRNVGPVLNLCAEPGRRLYRDRAKPDDRPAAPTGDWAAALAAYLGQRQRLTVTPAGAGEVFWRQFTAGDQRYLLVVNSGTAPLATVQISRRASDLSLVAADGAKLVAAGDGAELRGLDTFAVVTVKPPT